MVCLKVAMHLPHRFIGFSVLTRGDGERGNDVTAAALKYVAAEELPRQLDAKTLNALKLGDEFEIRGYVL